MSNRGLQYGKFVRDVRESFELNQHEFAELLGVCSGNLVSIWEMSHGEPSKITVELIGRLANRKFSGSAASSLTNRVRVFAQHKPSAAQVAGSPKRKSNAA